MRAWPFYNAPLVIFFLLRRFLPPWLPSARRVVRVFAGALQVFLQHWQIIGSSGGFLCGGSSRGNGSSICRRSRVLG